jgi:hypothetical protein
MLRGTQNRVTRLAEVSTNERLFSLLRFCEDYKSRQILQLLAHVPLKALMLTEKTGWATFWATFWALFSLAHRITLT